MPAPALLGLSVGTSIIGMGMQYSAAQQQAAAAKTVAQYNANLDIQKAKQGEADLAANIMRQRLQNKQLLASQKAGYAAAGVLSGSGTPLDVQATTAARLETDIQQAHVSQQTRSRQLYEAAQMGIWEGDQQASAYRLQSYASLIGGVGNLANMASNAGLGM